ncbi:MAG TPA: 8-amino-7-oxononanoate synthase [Myxococcales bacterium]|nr:8-amino-7-oxononanoate synthase [Myxococcales bacterium]
MAAADALAREELAAIASNGLLRTLEPLRSETGPEVELESGERLVNFSSNDYLGLASHPKIRAALAEGAQRWGAGSGASRLVCGDFAAHHALEDELARFEGTEAAVAFNSGYAANCGVLPSFAGPEDVILSDALNHASLVDGCRLSRARTEVYPHADAAALEAAIRRVRQQGARRVLVATDTVFSMDGDLAPLRAIVEVCDRHEAILLVDEAHATGVIGPRGAGLVTELGLGRRVDLRMGTLSKAAGAFGAYVAASRACCDLLLNRARPLVFSTALPPAVPHAALAALRILSGEEGDALRARLRRSVDRFSAGLRALGLPALAATPIFPIVLGAPEAALAAAAQLRKRGLMVKPIRPPTVPAGSSRLRIVLNASHTDGHVDQLLSALREAA